MKILSLFFGSVFIFMLSGCGQTGSLYLPADKNPPAQTQKTIGVSHAHSSA